MGPKLEGLELLIFLARGGATYQHGASREYDRGENLFTFSRPNPLHPRLTCPTGKLPSARHRGQPYVIVKKCKKLDDASAGTRNRVASTKTITVNFIFAQLGPPNVFCAIKVKPTSATQKRYTVRSIMELKHMR